MARYTIELGTLMRELGFQPALSQYPIFNEQYRSQLNQKIIDHFYFREIGSETPDRFNFYLERKMNEIMPYYNQLYESEMLKFNPLYTTYLINSESSWDNESNFGESIDKTDRSIGRSDIYANKSTGDAKGTVTYGEKENISSDYKKDGWKTVNETENRTEDLQENITANSLTTNDLTENTKGQVTTDTNSKENSSSVENFSDIPQAGIETTRTILPDGTIQEETHGYLTTQTQKSANTNTTTHSDSDSESTTTNTGTVNIDSTSNKTNDNTINTNRDTDEKWGEAGSNTSERTNNQDTQTTDIFTNTDDNQRNIQENEESFGKNAFGNEREKNGTRYVETAGRAGNNPAELIRSYREILLNIDMQVINALEPLFMGIA